MGEYEKKSEMLNGYTPFKCIHKIQNVRVLKTEENNKIYIKKR